MKLQAEAASANRCEQMELWTDGVFFRWDLLDKDKNSYKIVSRRSESVNIQFEEKVHNFNDYISSVIIKVVCGGISYLTSGELWVKSDCNCLQSFHLCEGKVKG